VRARHWMTLSARPGNDCGIARPSALAVFRLIISSNFVGCSIGKSAGLAPFKILATYVAARLTLEPLREVLRQADRGALHTRILASAQRLAAVGPLLEHRRAPDGEHGQGGGCC